MTLPDLASLELGIVSGLATGCVLALIALAFNIVLASCGVFNLAQAAIITWVVVLSFVLIERVGLPPMAVLGIVVLISATAASLAEVIAVRRFLRDAKSLSHETMVSTLGLGLALTAAATLFFGSETYPVSSFVSSEPIIFLGVPIRPLYFVMLGTAGLAAAAMEVVLRRTEVGLVMRSVIADKEGASTLGVSVVRVVQGAFIASGVLVAVAAFQIAPLLQASVFVGGTVELFGFSAIAIGGFASFRGAIFGGMVVGLIQGIAPAFVDPTWARPFVYVVVLIVLMLRPAGIFGRAGLFGAAAARQV